MPLTGCAGEWKARKMDFRCDRSWQTKMLRPESPNVELMEPVRMGKHNGSVVLTQGTCGRSSAA